MPTINLNSFKNKKYKIYDFKGEFKDSVGCPEQGSRWLIYGGSGEGKTDISVQLANYLSPFGRGLYFSKEQADKNSIFVCFKRHTEFKNKNISIIYNEDFDYLINKLKKRNNYKWVIIDSIDYLRLTVEQYKELDKFKNIMFVFIAWKEGKKPKSSAAKAIEYMVDIKIEVNHFVAFPRSRYGGNLPFVIWEEGAKRSKKHAFLNI